MDNIIERDILDEAKDTLENIAGSTLKMFSSGPEGEQTLFNSLFAGTGYTDKERLKEMENLKFRADMMEHPLYKAQKYLAIASPMNFPRKEFVMAEENQIKNQLRAAQSAAITNIGTLNINVDGDAVQNPEWLNDVIGHLRDVYNSNNARMSNESYTGGAN